MAIYSLNIPYKNFEIGKVIDPAEFNANSGAIESKVNEVINSVNNISITNEHGEIVVPSYIKETYIDPVEIKSPMLTGNTFIGASGIVGMTSAGTTNDSIRFWAGSSNKNVAPFRVAHDGSVTMTKASIETQSDVNGHYVKMSGSRVEGGRADQPEMYLLGTANLTGSSRSGIFQSKTYLAGDNTPDYLLQITHNTIMFSGSNLVVGGANEDRPTIITKRVLTDHHTKTIPGNCTLQVEGGLNVVGDIYVNGVKMKLTPA